MKTKTAGESFVMGWQHAKAGGQELTAREIDQLYPEVKVDAFANGVSDFLAGDPFRLALIGRVPDHAIY
jgi:hypothetical protein